MNEEPAQPAAPPQLTTSEITKHVRESVLPQAALDILPQTWTPDLLAPVPQGYVSRVTNQSIANLTLTPLTWDSLDQTISGCVLASSGITVPIAGAYLVTINVLWDLTGGGQRQVILYKNADTTKILTADDRIATSGRCSNNAAMVVRLSAGDSLTPNVYQDQGAAVNVVPGTPLTWTRMAVVFMSN